MIHIVLYEPEIPQNTGNIMRICVAFNMKLHLIEPLGFSLNEKQIRRSNVNYTAEADVTVHTTLDDFMASYQGRIYIFSRYGETAPGAADLTDDTEDVYLLFGSESAGYPNAFLKAHKDKLLRIPMHDAMRSLNLANTVAMGAYEASRQKAFKGLSEAEPTAQKGPNYLDS